MNEKNDIIYVIILLLVIVMVIMVGVVTGIINIEKQKIETDSYISFVPSKYSKIPVYLWDDNKREWVELGIKVELKEAYTKKI